MVNGNEHSAESPHTDAASWHILTLGQWSVQHMEVRVA